MNRRAFLALTASVFGAEPADIMDTHVHFYDPFRPGGVPWPPKDNAVLYRRAMPEDYQALSKARVIIVEASKLFEDNQWILDLATKHSFIGGCVGHLDPADANFARQIEAFKRNPKFLGIRLGARSAEENIANLAPLAGAGLTLDLIGDGEMYTVAAKLSDRYPKLRMVLDHLPLPLHNASIRELQGRKHVYAKVSWILRSPEDTLQKHMEALDEVWSIFGENRVVYGSNWPVCDMVVPYAKVQQTAIDYFRTKPLHKYLLKNSRAAYRWGK